MFQSSRNYTWKEILHSHWNVPENSRNAPEHCRRSAGKCVISVAYVYTPLAWLVSVCFFSERLRRSSQKQWRTLTSLATATGVLFISTPELWDWTWRAIRPRVPPYLSFKERDGERKTQQVLCSCLTHTVYPYTDQDRKYPTVQSKSLCPQEERTGSESCLENSSSIFCVKKIFFNTWINNNMKYITHITVYSNAVTKSISHIKKYNYYQILLTN